MERVALLPILEPDLVYGRTTGPGFVKSMVEDYGKDGFVLSGDRDRLIYPRYVGRISAFVDCMTEANGLIADGYRIRLTFGGRLADPAMTDRPTGENVLVLPLITKGSLMDEQVRVKYQDRFESNGFAYVSDVDYRNYLRHGRVFLNPVAHDRVSYKLFSLNLVMAAKRGYRIFVTSVG